jgi:hypothetical protein
MGLVESVTAVSWPATTSWNKLDSSSRVASVSVIAGFAPVTRAE